MDLETLKRLLDETIRAGQVENVKAFDATLSKYFTPGEGSKKIGGEKKEEDKNIFKNLGDMAVAVYKGSDVRLKVPSGANEAEDSAGGFLVQSDIAETLIQSTYETGLLVPRCQSMLISAKSNSMVINGVDEVSRVNGSRYGGIQAYWENEADQITGTKPRFRQMRLWLKKLTGLAYVTDELLADAVALDGWLKNAFANEFGFKLDDAILNGLGVGQPLGILNAPCLVSVSKETDQDAATFVSENAVKMYTSMPAKSRANAVWICNGEVEDTLPFLKMEGTSGGVWPMYMPPAGLRDNPFGNLLGRPVIPVEQCQALGTKGDILFCDFNEYMLINKSNKGAAESAVSIHIRFDYNETAFRFVLRMDGQPVRNSAIAPYKGNKSLSPFVALNTRA